MTFWTEEEPPQGEETREGEGQGEVEEASWPGRGDLESDLLSSGGRENQKGINATNIYIYYYIIIETRDRKREKKIGKEKPAG